MKLITLPLFIMVISGTAQVQQTKIPEGKEFPLLPIPAPVAKAMTKDTGLLCGQYFYMASKDKRPNAEGKYTLTMFNFAYEDGLASMIMGMDKIVTIVDPTKSVPTATFSTKKTGPRDTMPFHWIIKLSSKDLAAAKGCIADPVGNLV